MPALTRHRLNWVKQNYLRAETLVCANALLVNHQAMLKLAQKSPLPMICALLRQYELSTQGRTVNILAPTEESPIARFT